jgi:hypothetical protein
MSHEMAVYLSGLGRVPGHLDPETPQRKEQRRGYEHTKKNVSYPTHPPRLFWCSMAVLTAHSIEINDEMTPQSIGIEDAIGSDRLRVAAPSPSEIPVTWYPKPSSKTWILTTKISQYEIGVGLEWARVAAANASRIYVSTPQSFQANGCRCCLAKEEVSFDRFPNRCLPLLPFRFHGRVVGFQGIDGADSRPC